MRHIKTITEPKLLTPADVAALEARLAEAAANLPVRLLYLHGSHAHGRQTALSDLDLAVLLAPGVGGDTDTILAVLDALMRVCGRDDIDLVVLDTAGSIIKDRVVRHGRCAYARSKRERIAFETAALKEALDFSHFSRVYDAALFRQLAEGRFLD
jgi:hypothetical protein